MKLKALALLLLWPALAIGQDAWQTGKLVKLTKTPQKSEVPRTHHGGVGREVEDIEWTMVIEQDHTLYFGEIDADNPPPLTENHAIQWMLVKDKIHYKDDNGKEHKAKLIKKRAEDAPAAAAPATESAPPPVDK